MAGAALHDDVQPEAGEVGVEHRRVVALEVGDVVVGVPLVGDTGVEGVEEFLEAVEVVGGEEFVQADGVLALARGAPDQVAQQVPVQALPHFAVRIAEPEQGLAAGTAAFSNGEIAGLEEQRFGGDFLHIEGGEQLVRADHRLQIHGAHAVLHQRFHQERRAARFEPVGGELPTAEQEQNVERVVHRLAQPAVAVVPMPHFVPIQPFEFRREHAV